MLTDMLNRMSSHPAQLRVALKALELGLSIRGGKRWCSDIELSVSAVARALGIDRRAVNAAIESIDNDKELSVIFSKLKPIASFKELAPLIGWGVIEIAPEDSRMPGILAGVSTKIAERGISIRQTMADDPDLKALCDNRNPCASCADNGDKECERGEEHSDMVTIWL